MRAEGAVKMLAVCGYIWGGMGNVLSFCSKLLFFNIYFRLQISAFPL